MERITSLVFLVSLLIIFVSECKYSYFYVKSNKVYNIALVVNQTTALSCDDRLGPDCKNCDQNCKAKHGPSTLSKCDGWVGMLSCTCTYECAPPSPPKVCSGGTGIMCSRDCPDKCCDTNCAQKYNGGHGFCNSLGTSNLCQCEYPC